jgi:hypothetical protein
MKALSIKQPWASLIASGRKTLEIRSWSTRYRGPLVVVASAQPSREHMDHFTLADAPLGATIAVVDLIEVREATPLDSERACWEVPPGMFAWRLANPRHLEPLAVRGRLNLWEIDDALVRLAA